MGLIARLRQMAAGTVSSTATSGKLKIVDAEQLLMPTGNAFRCPACNTLVQGEGFNVRQMAEEMARQNIPHVPMCVIGGKSYDV